jgi:hypothetical protein
VFRASGEHWYSGRVIDNGETTFRGVVVVRPASIPEAFPEICAPESSDRICITP